MRVIDGRFQVTANILRDDRVVLKQCGKVGEENLHSEDSRRNVETLQIKMKFSSQMQSKINLFPPAPLFSNSIRRLPL